MNKVRSRRAASLALTSQMAVPKAVALGAAVCVCSVLVLSFGPTRAVDGSAARSAVTSVEISAAANASTSGAAGLDNQARAPSWPFAGAISLYGAGYWIDGLDFHADVPDPEHGTRFGVRFASAAHGDVVDIDIGVVDENACYGHLIDNAGGVLLSYWRSDLMFGFADITDIWIPWGGQAFPILSPALYRQIYESPRTPSPGSTVDAEYHSHEFSNEDSNYWSYVDIDGDRYFYRSTYNRSEGTTSFERFAPGYEPDSEPVGEWELGALLFGSGWDGSVYGIREEDYETRCEAHDTYVFSADSGKLLGCAHAAIGPLFLTADELIEHAPRPQPPERADWSSREVDCSGHFSADMYRQIYSASAADAAAGAS